MPLKFGLAQHDGYKSPSEDYLAHKIYDNGYELFGVFDGHNTDFYSKMASYILPEILVNQFQSIKKPEEIKEILELAFEETVNTLEDGPFHGGTTAIVVVITESNIIIASVGDSIALYTDISGNLLRATKDHNTENKEECDRIIKAGGRIIKDKYNDLRVEGGLCVTRSIGDKMYRKYGVISTPHIDIIKREPGYLVIMSDSFVESHTFSFLFETLIKNNYSREDLTKYTYSFIEKDDLQASAERIVTHQVNKFKDLLLGSYSGDNTSLIYVEV